jgi:hypothetical protein
VFDSNIITRHIDFNPITLIEIGAFSSLSKLSTLLFLNVHSSFFNKVIFQNRNYRRLDMNVNTSAPFNVFLDTRVTKLYVFFDGFS